MRTSSPLVERRTPSRMARPPAGPLGVVVVGLGRAEQRHRGIADVLLDRPAESLDLGGHPPKYALELANLLRVARLGAPGEPDEVGEEHGRR